jgi:tRNA-splicing ligase RtcB (3'-phosphate/5'-hydroxy nucleic acid ligase)
MRLLTTDLRPDELAQLDRRFDARLRHIFFEGGRDVALNPLQRDGILRHGIQALLDGPRPESATWAMLDRGHELSDLMRCHALGGFSSDDVHLFADFIKGSAAAKTEFTRDDQTGSIGGGNHFVEIQQVAAVSDGATARRWGLVPGTVTIMAHSGSVGLGHQVGTKFMDLARDLHPGGRRPEHGFHVLPTDGTHGAQGGAYLAAMRAAANFAFVNRLFLGLMVMRAMSETLGRRVHARVVHDAPHNLIWSDDRHRHLHRKGACPALGTDDLDPEFPDGHPVIVPGSMGDSSWVLKGNGHQASFCSACHGAGRISPRGTARKADPNELSRIRVIGKIDPDAETFRRRPEIAAEWRKTMLEEAPSAYKPVTPIIDTVTKAGIADPVAELRPILTVKG